MLNIQKLLVPYGFDELSPHALDYALDLAGRLSASITLLYVAEVRVHGPHAAPYAPPDVAEQIEAAAVPALQKIVGERRDRGVSIEPVVRRGTAWEQICRETSARSIDLVVMASHGRRGMAHMLLGSVAEKVLRTAPCPVLIVRGGVLAAGAHARV